MYNYTIWLVSKYVFCSWLLAMYNDVQLYGTPNNSYKVIYPRKERNNSLVIELNGVVDIHSNVSPLDGSSSEERIIALLLH